MGDIPFFSKQQLIALRNKGLIDPENIDHYIARGRIRRAAARSSAEMKPEDVIDEVIASGIRGRGGGGFPAGVKWESGYEAAKEREEEIFIVCNADEGDPGAFMDRSIIETDPHSVLEGMLIGAFAIGSQAGLHLHPQGVPAGPDEAGEGDRTGGSLRPARRRHPRQRLLLRHTRAPRRRRLRLRRVDAR